MTIMIFLIMMIFGPIAGIAGGLWIASFYE